MLNFLKSTPAKVVTILLVVQCGILYSSIREEYIPDGQPLALMSKNLGDWSFYQEGVVEDEVREILQADDLLNRVYVRSGPSGLEGASLFVAAFRSQRNGKAPHSPKNCLPGSGWEWVSSSQMQVDVGYDAPLNVNRYIVARGEERSLVMYWYQSRDRTVASEYEAKFWVVADAIRYNRTDTALVRIVMPIDTEGFGDDTKAAEKAAEDSAVNMIRSSYPELRRLLPA